MRLIDADALKRKYEDNKRLFCRNRIEFSILSDKDKARVDELDNCIAEILNAPTIEPEPHWIPVTERLPEDGERVLCTHLGGLNPNRQVIEHIYENGQFVLGWEMDMNPSSPTFMQRYMGKVVAWMPLPEPYREEGEKL